MLTSISRKPVVVAILALILVLSGCAGSNMGGGTHQSPAHLLTITVSVTTASIQIGGTTQVTASGKDQYGNPYSIVPTFAITGNAVTITGTTITGKAAGSSTVTATAENMTSQPATITVALDPQQITFNGTNSAQTVGNTYTVSATSSSGLPVTITPLNPTICNLTTALAPGNCTLQATQPGNSQYDAATPVNFNITVSAVPAHLASINLSISSASINVGGNAQLSYTAVDQYGAPFTAPSVTYNVTGTAVTVSSGSGMVTGAAQGSASITATSGTVTSNSVSIAVGLVSQTVTFPTPASQAALTSEALSATASSGLAVTFSSSTPSVCGASGSTVSLLTIGTCTLTATQAGNGTYGAASQTVSFAVTGAPQTVSISGNTSGIQIGGSIALTGTSTSGLPVMLISLTPSVCSPTSALTAGSCQIQASQPGNGVYAAAVSITTTFPIGTDTNTITFPILSDIPALSSFSPTASASSGLPVTYTSLTPSVCSTTQTLTSGLCTIQANQAGNATYSAATAVSQSFNVTLATQTINFPAPTPGTTFTVSATSNDANATITFKSTTPSICGVVGNTVTEILSGDCIIEADATGDNIYATASTTQDVNIGQQVTTVSVSPSSATVNVGDSQTFTATALDQFNQPIPGANIFWLDGTNGPTDNVTGVNSTDTLATMTIAATSGSTVSNTATLNVNPAPAVLTVVTLAPQNQTINAPNGVANFAITAADQFGRSFTPLPTCNYQSSNPAAATIAANGSATATNTGTVPATTTITASCGSFTEQTQLTVNPPPFVKTLTVAPVTVGQFSSTSVVVTATDEYGNPFPLSAGQITLGTFNSSFVSVAIATLPGNLNIGGVAATTSTPVTVSVGSVSTTFNVTVTACNGLGNPTIGCYTPVLTTITVTPETLNMEFNGTQVVAASALDQHGAAFTGATYTWSATGNLTVDQSGNVVGTAIGSGTISAEANGVTGTSATITVGTAPYPSTPVIVSLFPPMAVAKDYTNSTQQGILPHSTAVVVNGTGFLPGALVCFGSDCGVTYTTFKSSTKLVMLVPWQDLTTAGTVAITVKNPALVGYSAPTTSAASNFTLTTKGFVTISFDDGYATGLKGTALFNAQGFKTTQFIITGNTCATIGTCPANGLRADGYPWGWNGVGPATGCQYSGFPLPVSASDISACSVGVGFPNYIKWTDVAALAASGNEIAPHTRSHNQLSLESAADVTGELQGALADLNWHAAAGHDTVAGYKVTSVFAYPYGDYGCYASEVPPVGTFDVCVANQFNDQQLGTQVKQAGYRGARTSDASLEGGLKYEEGATNSPLSDDCSNDSCYGRADQPLFIQTITADQTAGDTCSFAGGTACDTSASNGAAPCMENGVAVAKPGFKCWVDNAVQTGTWVVLLFHRIDDNTADNKGLSVNSTEVQKLALYLKAQGITTVTFRQGLAMEGIDGQYEPVDSNGNIVAYPDPID